MVKQYDSSRCFLCGRDNERGMRLTWYSDFDKQIVWTEAVIEQCYNNGTGTFTHGGIVTALLDETAGRAMILEEKEDFYRKVFFVTSELTVKFLRPTPLETPLKVFGWVEESGEKGYKTGARIELADGTITASAIANMAKLPQKTVDKMKLSNILLYD